VSVRLFAFTCGWLEGNLDLFLPEGTGRLRAPVPSYLVEHPKGRVVFDTGMHPHVQTAPAERLGFLSKIFRVDFSVGEDVGARLEAMQIAPDRVDFLVNSHLHFDHAGGNQLLPNARWVVQEREWNAARDPDLSAGNGLAAADWDHGHDMLTVDGEHDLFGDGSVVCVPTWGHTPGHQSLRVRLDSGDVLLAADACYLRQSLEEFLIPQVVYDREQMLASMHRLRDLQARGARIYFGHDPEFWNTVPQGTAIV
jgi:N-acyl homoserine lactone hydrolase